MVFLFLGFYLHPAGQTEHDPVLTVHRHAVHQPGPQALVELGIRVPIKTCFDGRRTSSGATELSEPVREANGCAACEDARQVLHALDEPLDLPAADHDLTDLLDDLTQKNRMRMHTVMHSHPIFCPNLSTKGPNQFAFQNCLMNTCLRPRGS